MHFNICKPCIPWYTNDGDEDDVGHDDDESGDIQVRRAIGVHMIEELETDELPTSKKDKSDNRPLRIL